MGSVMTYERWRAWLFETRNYRAMDWTEHEPRGAVLAQYMFRLFEQAGTLVGMHSAAELATGTWELFGNVNGYFHEIREGDVPADLQVQVYRAIPTFYLDLLDVECRRHPEHESADGESLASAVYMIWDMCGVEYPTLSGQEYPHLVVPCFEGLERILMRSHSAACVRSALHGLGHADVDDDEGARVASIVDTFLAARSDSFGPDLIAYARLAREGRVR